LEHFVGPSGPSARHCFNVSLGFQQAGRIFEDGQGPQAGDAQERDACAGTEPCLTSQKASDRTDSETQNNGEYGERAHGAI